MATQKDGSVRAMTTDGAFRVITANMTEVARAASSIQNASGTEAVAFSNLLLGTVLTRETMSPGQRVQASIRDVNGGQLFADSHPGGLTRGVITRPQHHDRVVPGQGSMLRVARKLYRGELHESLVAIADNGEVSETFMQYMQASEQVTSFVNLMTDVGEDGVTLCGGFIVQLLPEVTRDALEKLTRQMEGLTDFESLMRERLADPAALMERIMAPFDHEVLDHSVLFHGCTCCEARMLAAVVSIGRAEIQSIVDDGKPIQIACDYCKTSYELHPHQLQALIEVS